MRESARGAAMEEVIADRIAAHVVAEVLKAVEGASAFGRTPAAEREQHESWRVKLWEVPPETRMNKTELLEALGRGESWLYSRTSQKCSREDRIPSRRDKSSNDLVFLAGEIRDWIRSGEIVVHPGSIAQDELVKDDPNLEIGR